MMRKIQYGLGIVLFFLIHVSMGQWTVHNFLSTGLTIDEPVSIRATSAGDVWIGTKESGVGFYDGSIWDFYDIATTGFPNNYIRTVYSFGSNVWVGTGYNGAGKYTGSWSTVNRINTSNGLADDEVLGMAHDGNVFLWFATYNGLSVDSITKWRTYTTSNSSGMPTNQLGCLRIDSENNKWIATDGHGLLKFNNNVWTSFKTDNSGIPSNTVKKIAIAPNGKIWVCTPNGLAEFDGANDWVIYNTSNITTVTSNVFNDIAIDNSGNIILATNDGVVTRSVAGGWARFHNGNSALPENTITSTAINTVTNKAWVGTLASGVAEADLNTVLSLRALENLNDASVVVYPNPIQEELNLVINFAENCEGIEVVLYDLSGKQFYKQRETSIGRGVYKKVIDVSNLTNGFYLLNVVTSNGSVTKKLIKY